MKFAFFTFLGDGLPIAKRLLDEGNEVLVGQVSSPSKLKVDGWMALEETPEKKKRRLSMYNGIIEKIDADALLKQLRFEKDKGMEDYFIILDHNNLCEYGEKLLALGFTGLIPNRADYELEKDRAKAKKFVEKNYDCLEVLESHSFKKAEDGIVFTNDSEDLLVLKSNGNLGITIVPKTKDVRLNHMEIIGALKNDGDDYETGGFILEKKIRDPIEFTPELVFWNGEPIYSQVEIECKPIGAGDTGPDGGGAINLIVRTDLNDPINELFFPKVVYKLAKSRRGLFIFDAGVLYDPDDAIFYFTEFAGNRFGYGGIFSELSMATNKNRNATEYFERVSSGKNPLRYKYGATVTLYNIMPDSKFPALETDGIPVYHKRAADEYLWLAAIKKEDEHSCPINISIGDMIVGFASACGNSLSATISSAYKIVDNLSFRQLLYRPKSDFLSKDYSSSILNRFDFLNGSYINVAESSSDRKVA
jgi:hypothetical protein